MNSSFMNVIVIWESDKLLHLPKGISYSTISKFPEEVRWPDNSWSIELLFIKPPSEIAKPHNMRAKAGFMVENAPWDRLKSGVTFDLYEGYRKTATILVE